MLTALCAKSLARLKHRQRALEKTRDSAVLSPDLSTKALSSAPDFWDRQHKAFAYVDSQIQRVKHSARFTTGLLAFALIADAGIVLAGIGTANALQRWQQQQAFRNMRSVDPVAEQMMVPLQTLTADGISVADLASDPVLAPQKRLLFVDAETQKDSLRQLAVLRNDPRVVDILAEVALNDIDFSRDVRKLAIELLNQAPDKRTTTLNQLLSDSDPNIRQLAYASLSAPPSHANARRSTAANPEVQSVKRAERTESVRHAETAHQQVEGSNQRRSKLSDIDYWRRNQLDQNVPQLITYLSDGDATVRESSALALGDLRDERALIPLHARLGRESNPNVRLAIVRAIGQVIPKS